MLADIRNLPGSRRFTHFSPEALRDSMTEGQSTTLIAMFNQYAFAC
jgi:hypothetical protein